MALLSAELLRKLSTLALRSSRKEPGVRHGERRSSRRGLSQEFADHRPYVPGDDLRFLDWHLYGRLDALWIKRFEEEQDRLVVVLLDRSASMTGAKLDYARKVAAALSFVSLSRADRVAVATLGEGMGAYAPPMRGRAQSGKLFEFLEGVVAGGGTRLEDAVAALPRHQGSAMALLFTDFLWPESPEGPLRRLLGRGMEVHAFQVHDPAELDPDLNGEVTLVDSETGEELAVVVDDRARERLRQVAAAHWEQVAKACHRLGVPHHRLLTTVPVEEAVLGELRAEGWVGR